MQVDPSTLPEQDRLFYEKYGRLPPQKKPLGQRLKGGDRKYFDSGDYAMSKAGKTDPGNVGSDHPSPERIPHSIPQNKKSDTHPPSKESGLTQEQDASAP
ncbi:camp-regulated phosphoprotein/endosulfine conserved region-domain-containing protein [Globomyces pollinis-pini]|nr:camp-regulated phosphoprotein/endosulfine conserved region-domain-containing protein [Globomyces pollinis-pini]KAJ2999560.1 hypothetical protein HDV02_002525 [Globomyces sp. JEL0801]KAJ2999568.1 hypothetical protein HDV02_002533 [Globomyces sp. JEL0801]